MTPSDWAVLLGPLIGAGAGSYFGLKGALNGLKERTVRIEAAQIRHEAATAEVRDIARDTHFEVVEARRKLEAISQTQ